MMGEDAEWPKYGAFLVLELFRVDTPGKDEPEFFVQAVYNGHAVPMGGSKETLMPWEDFADIVRRRGLSGHDWVAACRSPGASIANVERKTDLTS